LSDTAMGWILLLLTLLTSLCGFVISCVEIYGEPEMYVRHLWYRFDKQKAKWLTWFYSGVKARKAAAARIDFTKNARKLKKAAVNVGKKAVRNDATDDATELKSTKARSQSTEGKPQNSKSAEGIKKARAMEQAILRNDEHEVASSDRMPSTFV